MGIRSPPRDVTHPDTDTRHANYEKENDCTVFVVLRVLLNASCPTGCSRLLCLHLQSDACGAELATAAQEGMLQRRDSWPGHLLSRHPVSVCAPGLMMIDDMLPSQVLSFAKEAYAAEGVAGSDHTDAWGEQDASACHPGHAGNWHDSGWTSCP